MVYNFQGLEITVTDEENNSFGFSVVTDGDGLSNLSAKWILTIDD